MRGMRYKSGDSGPSSDLAKSEAQSGEVVEWKAPVRPPPLLETTADGAFLEQRAGQEVVDATQGALHEYWRILRRRKGTLLLLTALGGLAGMVVASTQPVTYMTTVALEVEDNPQDFTSVPDLKLQPQTLSAQSDISTQIRLLEDEGLADRAKAKLRRAWEEIPIADNSLWSPRALAPLWRLIRPPQAISLDSLLAAAAKSVKASQSGMARVIELEVDSVDARLAADFANTLADEFINQNIELRWKMSEHAGDWLDKQLQNTRRQLEQSEDNLQSYARSAGLLVPGAVDGKSSTSVSEDKLRQLQTSLSGAITERVAKQSRYEIARASPPEGLPDLLNNGTLHEYRSKVTELERQIADLTALYTADYPKVKRLQAQLHLAESYFDQQRSAILEGIKDDYDEALKRENLLTGEYENQARTVTGENEKSIRYSILKRDVDSNRQLYDAMLQRIKEADVSAALRASNIHVLDAAKIPTKPYKPAPRVDAAIGLFVGLFLGAIVVVVWERSDRSFRGPGQTALWLNIPELGIIPHKKHNSAKGLYDPDRRGRKEHALPELQAASAARHAIRNRATRESPELVTLHRKSSMMAEAFRIVLPYMLSQNRDGNDLGSIVLTSANPGEGKTTVACNLAITLAEIGRKVLLVDGDLRRPRLHKVFGLDNTFGLGSILQGGWSSIKAVSQKGHAAGSGAIFDNLHVLPSGPPIREVGKALFTDSLPDLFATLKEEFEIVLIDAPPVFQVPDARVLGRMADGVILIVRAGHTTRAAALAAFRSLSDVQCRVLGTILNYWDPNEFPFESYTGYYGH